MVRSQDAEAVGAGRQVVVERLTSGARLLPVRILALELVAEPHLLGHGETGRGVVHLDLAGQRREPQAFPWRVRSPVGDELLDVNGRWRLVEGETAGIDRLHEGVVCEPEATVGDLAAAGWNVAGAGCAPSRVSKVLPRRRRGFADHRSSSEPAITTRPHAVYSHRARRSSRIRVKRSSQGSPWRESRVRAAPPCHRVSPAGLAVHTVPSGSTTSPEPSLAARQESTTGFSNARDDTDPIRPRGGRARSLRADRKPAPSLTASAERERTPAHRDPGRERVPCAFRPLRAQMLPSLSSVMATTTPNEPPRCFDRAKPPAFVCKEAVVHPDPHPAITILEERRDVRPGQPARAPWTTRCCRAGHSAHPCFRPRRCHRRSPARS